MAFRDSLQDFHISKGANLIQYFIETGFRFSDEKMESATGRSAEAFVSVLDQNPSLSHWSQPQFAPAQVCNERLMATLFKFTGNPLAEFRLIFVKRLENTGGQLRVIRRSEWL